MRGLGGMFHALWAPLLGSVATTALRQHLASEDVLLPDLRLSGTPARAERGRSSGSRAKRRWKRHRASGLAD